MFGVPESEVGLLGDVAGLDIVDLGCGTGYFSAWLAKRGGRPVGIDVTPAQLDTARRLQAETGIEFPLVEASAEDVPLPDASFDLAFSEYGASIWCDPYLWIPEAYRLLRPGGRLVFLANSPLVILCALEDPEGTSETLQRPQHGMHKIAWADGGVEFHLGHGDMLRVLRETRFRGRGARRALRARGRQDARVLRVRHGRLGAEVAGRGDMGGAQARLTLASTSPQRRAILEQLAIPFDVVAPGLRRRRPARCRPHRARPPARRREGALRPCRRPRHARRRHDRRPRSACLRQGGERRRREAHAPGAFGPHAHRRLRSLPPRRRRRRDRPRS